MGEYQDCPCAPLVTPIYRHQPLATDWLDTQQQIFSDLYAAANSTNWTCAYGAQPHNNNLLPKEYCQCGDTPRHTLTFSVASSTASDYKPCPYTTAPGPTLTFSTLFSSTIDPPSSSTAIAPPTTTQSSPPPAPTEGTLQCNPSARLCYDVSPSTVHDTINNFCDQNGGKVLKPGEPDLVSPKPKTGGGGSSFDYPTMWYQVRGGWAPGLPYGCADAHEISLGTPLQGFDCKTELSKTFDGCKFDCPLALICVI